MNREIIDLDFNAYADAAHACVTLGRVEKRAEELGATLRQRFTNGPKNRFLTLDYEFPTEANACAFADFFEGLSKGGAG